MFFWRKLIEVSASKKRCLGCVDDFERTMYLKQINQKDCQTIWIAMVRSKINRIGKKLTKWRMFKNKVLKFSLFHYFLIEKKLKKYNSSSNVKISDRLVE